MDNPNKAIITNIRARRRDYAPSTNPKEPPMPKLELKPALNFLLANQRDDLNVRQLSVLLACAADKQTVRGLAERFAICKPAITRSADKLEGLGFLTRKPDPIDRRSVFMSLTPAGKKFASNFA